MMHHEFPIATNSTFRSINAQEVVVIPRQSISATCGLITVYYDENLENYFLNVLSNSLRVRIEGDQPILSFTNLVSRNGDYWVDRNIELLLDPIETAQWIEHQRSQNVSPMELV